MTPKAQQNSNFFAGKRVLVTGGAGFLGQVVVDKLRERGCRDITVPRRATCDLTQPGDVTQILEKARPDILLHLAASVDNPAGRGNAPASFCNNVLMSTQLIDAACRRGIDKMVCLGSASSYPLNAPIPLREEDLFAGLPESTRAAHGIAKRLALIHAQTCRRQHGFRCIFLIPTNFYGPGDNFNSETCYVIPALIRKFVEAAESKVTQVIVGGTGKTTRDFLYVEDCAEGILQAAEGYDASEAVNLGSGIEVRIDQLALTIANLAGFSGRIIWDEHYPEGPARRVLDITRAQREFGFQPAVSLREGLRRTMEWWIEARRRRTTLADEEKPSSRAPENSGGQIVTQALAQHAPTIPNVKVRTTCRSCGSDSLTQVLDLGDHYISNFVDVPDAALWPHVPLELLLCSKCSLVQLRHTVPGEWLYQRYWYKSGINASMCVALGDIARKASEFVGLHRGDSVLDIGCNDGTLLRSYTVSGIRRTGFEPAANLQEDASRGTDRIFPQFFAAGPVAGERFRVVTSIAMFYDLEDPNTFVADLRSILAEDGVWIIEMHYLPLTLASNGFDAICHEHLEYYSLASLETLLARHGLAVADVETNEVNGGSLRVYVVHRGSHSVQMPARRERVRAARASEQLLGLDLPETYKTWGERIRRVGDELGNWLRSERAHGKEISVYGASTKGNTLLQVFGFDHSLISSAAERNPAKWGKYTVGTWIPIVSETEARARANDFLILPWHFLSEMQEREKDFLARGGKLIAPLPEPRVIDSMGVHAIA